MSERQRTILQNRSLHKYFKLMSDEMNNHGITQRLLFDAFKEMDTTEHSVKQAFQRVSMALYGTDETHKLTTKQMMKVYDTFDLYISQTHGVHIEWPCDEPPMLTEHGIAA